MADEDDGIAAGGRGRGREQGGEDIGHPVLEEGDGGADVVGGAQGGGDVEVHSDVAGGAEALLHSEHGVAYGGHFAGGVAGEAGGTEEGADA